MHQFMTVLICSACSSILSANPLKFCHERSVLESKMMPLLHGATVSKSLSSMHATREDEIAFAVKMTAC